jgi:hypothetical protein
MKTVWYRVDRCRSAVVVHVIIPSRLFFSLQMQLTTTPRSADSDDHDAALQEIYPDSVTVIMTYISIMAFVFAKIRE